MLVGLLLCVVSYIIYDGVHDYSSSPLSVTEAAKSAAVINNNISSNGDDDDDDNNGRSREVGKFILYGVPFERTTS